MNAKFNEQKQYFDKNLNNLQALPDISQVTTKCQTKLNKKRLSAVK